jgi:hypothetical protein
MLRRVRRTRLRSARAPREPSGPSFETRPVGAPQDEVRAIVRQVLNQNKFIILIWREAMGTSGTLRCPHRWQGGHLNDDPFLPGSDLQSICRTPILGKEPAQIDWCANSTLKVTLLNADCDALRCSEPCRCLPRSAQFATPRRDCYHTCSGREHSHQRCRRSRGSPELGCDEQYCQ